MTIFRKEHVEPFMEELDRFHNELRSLVEGEEPSTNIAERYHCGHDQFIREYVDIDLNRLAVKIAHFKVAVDNLKHLKKVAAKPIHQR